MIGYVVGQFGRLLLFVVLFAIRVVLVATITVVLLINHIIKRRERKS